MTWGPFEASVVHVKPVPIWEMEEMPTAPVIKPVNVTIPPLAGHLM